MERGRHAKDKSKGAEGLRVAETFLARLLESR